MTSSRRGGLRAARLTTATLLGLLAAILAPSAVMADPGQLKLALLPVGQPGSYFDLTMRPGESRSLEITIANDGDSAIAARTYAADVYTIINGGFGARLRGEPATGMTSWLDYPTQVLHLASGSRADRSFTVVVPNGTGPGEYITSLILENDEPIAGNAGVAFEQVVRQAVAVVITVPGERSPALGIGRATHSIVAGRSVVRVAVRNTGNIRLKPVVGVTLIDAMGVEVGATTVLMDTFYARTDAFVEVSLATLLRPGAYVARIDIGDTPHGVPVETVAVDLVVDQPTTASIETATVPGVDGVPRDRSDGQILVPVPMLVLIAILALALGLALAILYGRRRRPAPASA